jgi:hypothetical protein
MPLSIPQPLANGSIREIDVGQLPVEREIFRPSEID